MANLPQRIELTLREFAEDIVRSAGACRVTGAPMKMTLGVQINPEHSVDFIIIRGTKGLWINGCLRRVLPNFPGYVQKPMFDLRKRKENFEAGRVYCSMYRGGNIIEWAVKTMRKSVVAATGKHEAMKTEDKLSF